MSAPTPRTGSPDSRLMAGAGLAVLAAIVVVALAWSRSFWLGLPVLVALLAAPAIRAYIGPRLVGARDLPEDLEPELYRLVRTMCRVRDPIPEPGLMITETATPVAIAGGWPLRRHVIISQGLLTNLGHDAQKAMIVRELSRLRQPYAVIDGAAWALAPLGLVVLIARLPSIGGIVLGVLGLAIALAALVILMHAREVAADDEALERTGQRAAVEEAIRAMDRNPPGGAGWLLAAALLLVPPPRFIANFIPPTADDRVARLADPGEVSTEELTGMDSSRAMVGTITAGGPDSTARLVLLGVLAVAGAIIVLAMTALGGGESAADGDRRASGTPGTAAPGTGTATGSVPEAERCPSAYNGEPDAPVILDAGVAPELFDLRWWVRWCDDTDKGDTFIILRLSGQERHMIRREVPSRAKPGLNEFRITPAVAGISPGRYRWRLVVRDVNANTDERRGTGTIFVPGVP